MVINRGHEELTLEKGYAFDYVEAAQKFMNEHTKGSWVRTGDWPLVLKNEKTGEYCDLQVYEDIDFERMSCTPSWVENIGSFEYDCENYNEVEYIVRNLLKPKYYLAISESCDKLAMLDIKQLSYDAFMKWFSIRVKRSDVFDLQEER